MADNTLMVEYTISHELNIHVANGMATFNYPEQKIFLLGLYVSPAMEVKSIQAMAHYPNGAEQTVADAVNKIVNVSARATEKKAASNAKVITSAEMKKTDDKVNEANSFQLGKQMPDMDITVITDNVNITTQAKGDETSVVVKTTSADMTQFITYKESKKIKVFINGQEIQPKAELEFIKRVFPQIDITVFFK